MWSHLPWEAVDTLDQNGVVAGYDYSYLHIYVDRESGHDGSILRSGRPWDGLRLYD